MKKTFLALLVFLPSIIHAQEPNSSPEKKSISVGVVSGITFSDMYIKNWTLPQSRTLPMINFTGGLKAQRQIWNHFFIETSVLYERKGKKTELIVPVDPEPEGILIDSRFHLHYLSLPVILNVKTKGRHRFYFGAGVQSSYLLTAYHAEAIYDFPNFPEPGIEFSGYMVQDFTNILKRYDIAGIGQAGYEFPINDHLFGEFQIRASHGLFSIYEPEFFADNVEAFHRTLGATFSINYSL